MIDNILLSFGFIAIIYEMYDLGIKNIAIRGITDMSTNSHPYKK
jgi:membrane-bound ClpP family serine protease